MQKQANDMCPCCGLVVFEPHKKYTDRCVECGKRYHKYSSYKSMQKKCFDEKREAVLNKIRVEYEQLKFYGYKVPKDIV